MSEFKRFLLSIISWAAPDPELEAAAKPANAFVLKTFD